jgi:hypothetical protein
MLTIDTKTYNNITFISEKNKKQKTIIIVLHTNLDIHELHNVDLISEYNNTLSEALFMRDVFDIKFTLPAKYFKKMIMDVKTFSNELTIKQESFDDDLQFEYTSEDKKIKSFHIVKNPEKIKFVSNLTEEDTFRISVLNDHIKPISSCVISDNIDFIMLNNEPILGLLYIENEPIEIRVLTNITL